MPLHEKGMVKLIEGDTELAPGVKLMMTGGHTAGHQIVFVESGSHRIAYVADLIPTAHHLALASISANDHAPNDSLDRKRQLLEMAAKDGWMLVFGHAIDQRAGYVEFRNGRTQFQPVEF